jgi:hypothetical protein
MNQILNVKWDLSRNSIPELFDHEIKHRLNLPKLYNFQNSAENFQYHMHG